MRAPKAGGAATAIVLGQEAAFGIALDAGHVYWTSKYDGGTLRRAGLGGAGAATLSWSRGNEGITNSVVTDGQGIYWVVDGSAVGKPGQVWKLAKP